jgi:antitoxin CptB
MTDSLAGRRKRALFRSLRRGTRESDMILGGFAKSHIELLSEDQVARFEILLDRNDNELLSWIGGWEPVPPEFDHDVMSLLQHFKSGLGNH